MADASEFQGNEPLLPMQLTNEELEWSLALKQEVIEDEELLERPDFEYAMVTLLCMDDLEGAKERLRSLQHFREEYRIHDTLEEGVELLLQHTHQQPWFILDVHVDANTNTAVVVKDFSVLNPSKVNTPSEQRTFMGGEYYLYQLVQPTFGLIREGVLAMAEGTNAFIGIF